MLAPNGKIYMAPNNANSIGVLDPSSDQFSTIDISSDISSVLQPKYFSGVLGADGKIYFVPYNANNIGVFDPSTDYFSTFDISAIISSGQKYAGGALAADGIIYFAPDGDTEIGAFDPARRSFTRLSIPAIPLNPQNGGLRFDGAVAGPNGHSIYFIPRNSEVIGVLEVSGACSELPCSGPDIDGGGWTLVRRVPAGTTWHAATDNCAGTAVYGTMTTDWQGSSSFSIVFEEAVPGYDEMLFATGDSAVWLIASKEEVVGNAFNYYNFANREILKSSDQPLGPVYEAEWVNRGDPEDPWISVVDHLAAVTAKKVVYGESGNSFNNQVLQDRNGANVFIRKNPRAGVKPGYGVGGGLPKAWKTVLSPHFNKF